MKLHLLTLKFSGESSKLEAPFLSYYYRMSLPQIRRFIVLGALVYAFFGILDALLMPELKSIMWFIRFVIVGPVILGTLLASYSKYFERYMQPLMTGTLIMAGGGIVFMIVIAPIPVNYYYYAGLMLVFMWGYTFVCVRFLWASLAGWVQVVLYEIAAIWINPTPIAVLISNNFFFISANVIGMLACYFIELYARRDFFLTQQLEFEQEKTKKVNQELERRMTDYQIINRELEHEIAGHKRAEEVLRESEEKYRLIAENTADLVIVTDMNLRFTYISPSIMRIRGFTVEEAMEHTLEQTMTPESLKITLAAFEEEMKLEASGTADPDRIRIMELEEYKKNGSLIWLEVGFSFLHDKDRKPIAILAVSRDISARKRADDELKKSKALLESVFNSSQDLMLVVDRDLKILMSNWKSSLYAGHTEFPINSHCYEAFNHRDIPCEPCHALSVFNTGEPIREEHYNQYTQLFMEVNAYPIFDDNHHVIMVAEHVRNITDRKQAAEKMRKALGATVQAIAVTVETRDPYTAGHQRRVADLAHSIATEMNLPAEQIDGIRMAAAIHDLGKISVPAEILSKPKKLTAIEFSLIKTHAKSGYDILKNIDFPWPIARMILEHHERMNGSGYPNGLTGDNLLMESRILSVADVVESMGSHRPYRPSLGIEAALEEIEKNRGTLYDNTVADACLRLFREKGYQLEGT